MEKPMITYSVKMLDENMYTDTSEYYAGTYIKSKPLKLLIRIWNNKYGIEEVEPLKDFAINFYFGSFEDAPLIQFVSVKYDTNKDANIEIVDNIAVCTFWESKVLSGAVNNGKDSDRENYIDLAVEFDTSGSDITLKNLDLKSLYMEIVQQ